MSGRGPLPRTQLARLAELTALEEGAVMEQAELVALALRGAAQVKGERGGMQRGRSPQVDAWGRRVGGRRGRRNGGKDERGGRRGCGERPQYVEHLRLAALRKDCRFAGGCLRQPR